MKSKLHTIAKNDFKLINSDTSLVETLIIIPSLFSKIGYDYRDFIRQTWKKTLTKDTKLLFFIGIQDLYYWDKEKLNKEQLEHNDIVYMDIHETYKTLSLKMAEIYLFIYNARLNRDYSNLKWVFKTDTDVWFNPDAYFKVIKDLPQKRTWVGSNNILAPVLTRGPWANKKYTSSVYPLYNAGAGYAVTIDIIEWVALNYNSNFLKLMTNEDALLGIWLAGLNVHIIDTPYILPQIGRHGKKLDAPWDSKCSKDVFLVHNLSLKGIKDAHTRYKKCQTTCSRDCELSTEEES